MATRVKTTAAAPKARTRVQVKPAKGEPTTAGNSYFADSTQRTGLEFVSTGCAVLDEVMGGGYALGRMSNLIGDKSTGKTLLAIEAAANFYRRYPNGTMRYLEAESAFDRAYARALGMPVEQVQWVDMVDKKGESDRTVEFMFEDLDATMRRLKGEPGLYIVDSLDALSDRAEMKRDISDGSYGAAKAKKLGEMFRRLVGDMEKSRLLLIIISQIRDKLNVTFGETKMRAGGHAMDFYATHCLWLAQVETFKRTVNKIEMPVGLGIRAKCKKNKIGLPLRQCDFPLLFGYGIDDLTANVEWLLEAGREEALDELGFSKSGYKVRINNLRNKGGKEMQEVRQQVARVLQREWAAVQSTFLPATSKY